MLRLVFEGIVLRTDGRLVVVTIERPDFRTAGKSTDAAREEIAAMANGIGALSPTRSVPLVNAANRSQSSIGSIT
jgi:hypothetical protein